MNKKGQFYLLAAIIIVAVIIGFAAVSNYAKKKSDVKIYDLGEELGIEGGQVLEFGTYKTGDAGTKLGEFSELYTSYAGENKELYFIFGDENKITVATYADIISGTIALSGESTTSSLDITKQIYTTQNIDNPADKVTITTLGGGNYDYTLKPG